MTPARVLVCAALIAAPGFALAEEPTGCATLRWPLERERAALAAATKPVVANGGAIAYDSALTLALQPFAEAGLPQAPERAPKVSPSFAGHFTLAAPPEPGFYVVTLASDGWVDLIDKGAFLHPRGFTTAFGCPGARKSVKFELPGRPIDVQVSNVRDAHIAVMVTPAE